MKRIFKTPNGLKLRLNYRYFFYQLVDVKRYYTDEEILNNDTMYNATVNIESFFLLPTALIQIFTIIAILTNIRTFTYCAIMFALFLFGSIWRSIKQDFFISTIMLLISTLYNALWWLIYPVLIILINVFDKTNIILPYICMRISLFIISLILNHITLSMTMKKYGIPFNDTEICAFMVFHNLSLSDKSLSSFIKDYVSFIHER